MSKSLGFAIIGSALLLASAVVAEDSSAALWEGNSGTLKSGCAFLANEAGSMRFSEERRIWEVTEPAKLRLRMRDIERVTVAAGDALLVDGEAVTTAAVDFRSPNTRMLEGKGGDDLDVQVDARYIEAEDLGDSKVEILLGGSVVPTDPSFVTSSNTDYAISHQITCEQ